LPTGLVFGHKGAVEDICFSPDGQSLATGDARGVWLWSVSTGELLGPVLESHNGACEVSFSPDGTRIAAGGFSEARLFTLSAPFRGDLRHAELWVQVLTWQEMDANGVLSWLDRESWLKRRAQLEKLGGPKLP
jgi:WD40 repeat protein